MSMRRIIGRLRTRCWLFSIASVIGLSALGSGCASATNEPARVPGEREGYIARPCTPLKAQASRGVPIALALEVADVEEAIGTPIKEWLAVHPVQLHSVAKFILPLTSTTPADGDSNNCSGRACGKSVDGTLEVSVGSAPLVPSAPVELQLVLSANGETRRLTVSTTDQEPVLVPFTTVQKRTLVLMPYYLFEPKQQSLDVLFQCAAREAGPIRVGDGPISVPPVAPAR